MRLKLGGRAASSSAPAPRVCDTRGMPGAAMWVAPGYWRWIPLTARQQRRRVRSFGRLGSGVSVLDFLHLGSSLSLRSFGRVGTGLSVLDFVHLGSSLSLRSFGGFGSGLSVLEFLHWGISLSLRS